MTRLLTLTLLTLTACTYPPATECPTDAGPPSELTRDHVACEPGYTVRWLDPGECLILRGNNSERWDCTAVLECSGDWLCVPSDARVSHGDPADCACEWRP